MFKLGELFCGPGGIALGATLAKVKNKNWIEHGWATDYDKDTCETFAHNIGSKKSIICKDIRKIEDFSIFKKISKVNSLAFGFPCNDFSLVGEQKGMDGCYGPLYLYCVKAIEYFKPEWFIAENVSGLKSSNDGKAFQTILSELSSAGEGYDLFPHLYKFEQYGVPQTRHRIIIVGIKKSKNLIFKIPSTKPFVNKDISAKHSIESPPISKNAHNNELTNQSKNVVERLKHIKPGENVFTATLPDHLKLNILGAKISQIYKRLDATKPSYTITGSGGGGTHGYHWSENRALTNRERARIQTFPDNFEFLGAKESVRKQIGMAVPPAGMKVIFEALIKTFLNINYNSCEQNILWDNKLNDNTGKRPLRTGSY